MTTLHLPATPHPSSAVSHPHGNNLNRPPEGLADHLEALGLPLNTRCSRRGLCHGCLVDLLQGAVRHLPTGNLLIAPQSVRACEVVPATALTLHIPQRSLLAAHPQILDTYDIRVPHSLAPLSALPYGLAIDLGTTTIALQLIDLATGQPLAKASAFNAQMRYGDDVITRISFCMQDLQNIHKLQKALVHDTLLPLIRTLNVPTTDIGAIVFAGNTTMLHLLLADDPAALGTYPFTPRFTAYRKLPSTALGETWNTLLPNADIHLLPSASAYIGADIVAGLLATAMSYEPQTTLLVDVGTNGEIALQHQRRCVACAAAAGPAFEGARLHSGSRAVAGAIDKVILNPSGPNDLHWIDQGRIARPTGLCGSAYIDFLAEARRLDLLTPSGRFQPASPFYSITSDLRITECDIASLLAAKAAIAAGIRLLLDSQHLQPQDVARVYLAGAFGTHMNPRNAIAIGLLPGFLPSQIHPVGNSSLAGAYLALTDASLLPDLSLAASHIQVLELNTLPAFHDAYLDALLLP